LQNFRVHVDALNAKLQATQNQISNGSKLKIVAIIDSISSRPGAYLPWKDMVAICRERGVLTVIDAAHSVGQEPNINLSEANPDFWVSVGPIHSLMLHGCAELRTHRTVTSGSLPSGLVLSFMYQKGSLRIWGNKQNFILL
jgi:Cys-tRNA synthase (O-phospho-L-seryl-tRNA:Cys-tRNA synthase)